MTEPRDLDDQCDHPCQDYLAHGDCPCVRDQRPIPPVRLSTPLPLGRPRPGFPRLTWVEFDEEEA